MDLFTPIWHALTTDPQALHIFGGLFVVVAGAIVIAFTCP